MIIDRVAVAVGNQVITASELEREVRLTAFLNQEPLRIDPEAKRQAANRLIEQKLVKRELEFGRYPLPSVEDIAPRLEEIRKRSASPPNYAQALQKYGITEEDLQQHLLWQLKLLKFIDIRFRPGIQITQPEIEEYYKTRVAPLEPVAKPGKSTSLDDYRERIEETIAGQRVDKELGDWLKEARARTRIEFKEEAFR